MYRKEKIFEACHDIVRVSKNSSDAFRYKYLGLLNSASSSASYIVSEDVRINPRPIVIFNSPPF